MQEVKFLFRTNGARSVKVAGTFTDWEKNAIELQKLGDGEWSAMVKLPSGEYQYKFLVDGEWFTDPNASAEVWNNIGSVNSWISV